MTIKYTKWPQNKRYGLEIDQRAMKYTNIFHWKTPQNLPKCGFLVSKHAIWQPWLGSFSLSEADLRFIQFAKFEFGLFGNFQRSAEPGLPDGIFSNQKSQFG
jgi:hypothetical protein